MTIQFLIFFACPCFLLNASNQVSFFPFWSIPNFTCVWKKSVWFCFVFLNLATLTAAFSDTFFFWKIKFRVFPELVLVDCLGFYWIVTGKSLNLKFVFDHGRKVGVWSVNSASEHTSVGFAWNGHEHWCSQRFEVWIWEYIDWTLVLGDCLRWYFTLSNEHGRRLLVLIGLIDCVGCDQDFE